jgi:hypothetical protein
LRWTISRARTLVRLGAVAAIVVGVACAGDSSGPKTPDGNYSISTINGKPLPATLVSDGAFSVAVSNGSLALTGDGKYTAVITQVWTVPGDVSTYVDTTKGTWVLNGASVDFTDGADGTKQSATWSGSQLTMNIVEGSVTTSLVYTRK